MDKRTGDEVALDQTDRRIVRLLVENAGLSNNQLAEKVGLSPAPLSRRLARLEAGGVIRHTVIVDPRAAGIGFQAFLEVTLERTAPKVGERFMIWCGACRRSSNAIRWPAISISC
nr:winged helix-turn-helix transcriptional regulator [uncultured Shinella sp.]